MPSMTLYAIRERKTNKYIVTHRGHGSTGLEPREPGGNYAVRLYPSIKSASMSLSFWIRGRHWQNEDGEWNYNSIPERKNLEMEVVPVRLEIPD